jgi:hypothetical protein
MYKNGLFGIGVLLLAHSVQHVAYAQSPELPPDAAQVPAPTTEAIPHDEAIVDSSARDTSQGCQSGSRLSRWWHGRAKPCLQYSHWGYPEYFEEPPFGASVRAVANTQICNGWNSRLTLYQYDFCDGAPFLNLHGQRKLNELAAAFQIWMHHTLRIEATPEAPRLDIARRDHIAKLLADGGVPARVEIGYPTEVSPFGDETRIVNENLLQRVRSGRPIGGMSGGGTGGMMISGGGNSGQSQ